MRNHMGIRQEGLAALDLVNQAARMISGIEERAASTEARAESTVELAQQVMDRAEERIRAAEQGAAETVARAEAIAQRAQQMMERANQRISQVEAALSAAEARAKAAETQVGEAKAALVAVQDAIRTNVLNKQKDVSRPWAEAA
jgi:chromosome segregation ATPase